MTKISSLLSQKKKQNQKTFVAYITAGDPDLGATKRQVKALAKGGADIIELGVPFSDPLADGPINQRAAKRSLQGGCSLRKILSCVQELRQEGFTTPIVLFSYLNPLLAMDFPLFCKEAMEAGVNGLLLVDIPVEEARHLKNLMDQFQLESIFLASPTTEPKRLDLIDQLSSGFVYYVSRTGVTGTQSQISESLEKELSIVRKKIHQPLLVGFGISTPEQAKQVAQMADGIIIGSAIVQIIEEYGDQAEEKIEAFCQTIHQALKF